MTPRTIEHPADLARLIPVHVRGAVKAGKEAPMYRVFKPDFDRLPLETFLFETEMGTGGRHIISAMRIVQPNDPTRYPRVKLTEGKRLVYMFWARGQARRALFNPRQSIFRHVVPPFDPRHAMVEAFKIACDHKHALSGRSDFSPQLLYRALGVEPLDLAP